MNLKRTTLVLLIFICSCQGWSKNQTYKTIDLNSYGINGKVEYYSETSLKVTCKDGWNCLPDTSEHYSMTVKRYFNDNGILDSIEYFSEDKILIQKTKYDYNNKNNIISFQYDKTGSEIKFSRQISLKDSILETETIDSKTKKTISVSQTKYKNKLVLWQKSKELQKKLYSEYIYERDEKGLEIQIKTIFGSENEKKEKTDKIVYLEFDSYGNWIKRIEYNSDKTNCLLKTRVFIFYK